MITQQRKTFRRLVCLLTYGMFIAGSCGVANAQDTPPATPAPAQAPSDAAPAAPVPPQRTDAVIRAESKLVIVDAIVTDKKGNYVHDLTQKDFKVFEDNKEQQVSSFSFGADAVIQAKQTQKHYLILFFDNSSMSAPDQIQARAAAAKFIDANAGPGHEMAVVEFGGTLRIAQNFTANADALHSAVKGIKTAYVASNTADTNSGGNLGGPDLSSIGTGEAEFGARSMLLSLRALARNLHSVPGRKMLVLFSAGFSLDPTTRSEMIATIDACNKANVAVYSLDVRGLVASVPGGMARNNTHGVP
jgi:VWFA-related protein